jgi:hypothetical protein
MHHGKLNSLIVRFLWTEAFFGVMPAVLIQSSRFVCQLDSVDPNNHLHSLQMLMVGIHMLVINFYLIAFSFFHDVIFQKRIFAGDGYTVLYPLNIAEWMIFLLYTSLLSIGFMLLTYHSPRNSAR